MRLTIENQEVVLYVDKSSVAYRAMIVDLDRIHLLGNVYLARHVIMMCLLPQKDATCLYRLGQIIQSRFPASIQNINWFMTYYFVEFDDYISKMLSIQHELQPSSIPIDDFDLMASKIDMWVEEQRNPVIRKEIAAIVRHRLAEYGILDPSTR